MDIAIEKLRKTYGDTVAVADIDLAVPKGQMLVLLGPSGCGKTTTMRCIAGLELPDAGSISIGPTRVFSSSGRVNVPVNRRNVGMVFQSYAIWPHMTVAENVAYPLDMARVPRAEKESRVKAMLAQVGLDGFADRGASYLSGGQMQRVALARSLVMRPSVLLFDEPLSNLDARLRDHLRVQLRELQTELGITSVYVTHDQREALALADLMAVMEKGRIEQIGDPVTVYRGPRSSSIADFLGYSNIFPATPGSGSAEVQLAGQTTRLTSAAPPPAGEREIAACVRPEDIRVRPLEGSGIDAGALPANTIVGDIILASFMGSYMQYRAKTATGQVWEAFSPDVQSALRLGTRVVLDVAPTSVLLLSKG